MEGVNILQLSCTYVYCALYIKYYIYIHGFGGTICGCKTCLNCLIWSKAFNSINIVTSWTMTKRKVKFLTWSAFDRLSQELWDLVSQNFLTTLAYTCNWAIEASYTAHSRPPLTAATTVANGCHCFEPVSLINGESSSIQNHPQSCKISHT